MEKRILVVDDEASYAQMLCASLNKAGYDTEPAHSGREALGALINSSYNDKPISLILLDIRLPDISGVDTLEIIRKEEKERGKSERDSIPVILITAYDEPWIDPKLMMGNTDIMVKSSDDSELIEKIARKLREGRQL